MAAPALTAAQIRNVQGYISFLTVEVEAYISKLIDPNITPAETTQYTALLKTRSTTVAKLFLNIASQLQINMGTITPMTQAELTTLNLW